MIAGTAFWFARSGDPERAVELLSFTQHHPATERHTLTRRVAPLFAELEGRLSAESFALAMARGKELDFPRLQQMLDAPMPARAQSA